MMHNFTPVGSVIALTHALRANELSLDDYIGAVEEKCNALEPILQTLVQEPGRFERLRRQARELLEQYPDPESRPPLFGTLVGIKDLFHIDGMPTRAGSKLSPDVLRGPQGELISRLQKAGTLVLGKTVMAEFAYFAPGATPNPHHLEHTPGGSSSGSAAAVSAGLCPFAVGTQTIGSIIRPAAFCGIVGFKPTYDRVPRSGVLPMAPSVDHVGFFTQDTADMQFAAQILLHAWRQVENVSRPVLGIPTGPYLERASEQGLRQFDSTIRVLSGQGFEIRRVPAMPDFQEIEAQHRMIVAAEAADTHQSWYKQYSGLYHPTTAELIERGMTISGSALAEAKKGRDKLRLELIRLMEEHNCDLWVTPAAVGPAPKGLLSTGDPVMSLPWTYSGLPSLTLPYGKSEDGLPFGTQFIGRWYQDEELLSWAALIENALKND